MISSLATFASMENIKTLLDFKLIQITREQLFVANDPISIPHRFTKKEDIEISAFLTAILSWGMRRQIIERAGFLMQLMDHAPHQFVMQASDRDFSRLEQFQYRTFKGIDCHALINAVAMIYRHSGGLEVIFSNAYKNGGIWEAIVFARESLLKFPHEKRTEKHLANPNKGSSAKRFNMFLRWMVRKDETGIDFGIWKSISTKDLICPLDLHTGKAARKLGLLIRKQDDRKAADELTIQLRKMDPCDPVKYDLALFMLSMEKQLDSL
ncbi:MAG: TIGR02757 family protein [Bacteroidales bacterium]|nr:TIGR02757 family protein [Bacteroidales bacterium]